MERIIQDIAGIARRCRETSQAFSNEPLATVCRELSEAIAAVGEASSQSWCGYHASLYKDAFIPRFEGEHFDIEWGNRNPMFGDRYGSWREYSYDEVRQEILRRAGLGDMSVLEETARETKGVFRASKNELLATLDALMAVRPDEQIRTLRAKLDALEDCLPANRFAHARAPEGVATRDQTAAQGGIQTPHHVRVQAWLVEHRSTGERLEQLGELATYVATFLEKRYNMMKPTAVIRVGPIFIGHGRSLVWRTLKDFLTDRLRLDTEEFNRIAIAGKSTKERLLEMLDRCCIAFLVMTAEDEDGNGKKHARENVVHEVGLFQGRYGFERAIVLLEDGCEEFSNLCGIGQIRFPRGNLEAVFEEVRRVLEREGLLGASQPSLMHDE